MPRRVVLFASDLAACIGMNRYESVDNMTTRYLKRFDEDKYKELKTKEDETERAIAEIDSHIATVEAFTDVRTKSINETIDDMTSNVIANDGVNICEMVKEVQDGISAICKDTNTFSPRVDSLIRDHVRKRAYTDLGTAKEALIASLYQDKKRVKLVKSDAFVKRILGAVQVNGENIEVYVGGKCDGIVIDEENKRELVEIKNRTRRLFYKVQDYELVQVLAYMFIYGIEEGTLVERYQDSMREYKIEFDAEEFRNIKDQALAFATNVVSLALVSL